MPEKNHGASEAQEAEEVHRVVLMSGDDPSEVEEPREETLDLPTPLVTTKTATVVPRFASDVSLRRQEAHAVLARESFVEGVAVVGLVADEILGQLVDDHRFESVFDEGDFVRRGAVDGNGD